MSTDQLSIRGLSAGRYGVEDLDLPLRQLICLRGRSGSGAHALAQEVLLGESRRRFLRALSPQERERFGGLGSAVEMEQAVGLPPARALPGDRADLRVLDVLHVRPDLARVLRLAARTCCPECGGLCRRLDDDEAVKILQSDEVIEERCLVIAPLNLTQQSHDSLFDELVRAGFPRVLVGGQVRRIDSDGASGRVAAASGETLHVVVDRLVPATAPAARLGEAIRNARAMGHGRALLLSEGEAGFTDGERRWLNRQHSCCSCGQPVQEPDWDGWLSADLLADQSTTPWQGVTTTHLGSRQVADLSRWRLDELDDLLTQLGEGASGDLRQLVTRVREAIAPARRMHLGHLPLWRRWGRLAFGERLALSICVAVAQRLSGLLYVLEPPLSGLAQARLEDLIGGLRELVQLGSTVVLVDGDDRVCRHADLVVDLPATLQPEPDPGPPISGDARSRQRPEGMLILRPRDGDSSDPVLDRQLQLDVPLGQLVCICGPSGGGKTALLRQLCQGLPGTAEGRARFAVDATGIRRCIDLDLQGMGREDETLLQMLMLSRDLARLFAASPAAVENQWPAEWFELDRSGGRCPRCEGLGQIVHRLEYVEDLIVTCPECDGRRFRDELLEATLRGANMAELLGMTTGEAARFLHREPRPHAVLQAAAASGLGDVPLGLPAGRLEPAQRLRALLAGYSGRADRRDLFVAERPGAGEGVQGARQVAEALRRLVSTGATVWVSQGPAVTPETSDWVLEMAPGAGEDGGCVLLSSTAVTAA